MICVTERRGLIGSIRRRPKATSGRHWPKSPANQFGCVLRQNGASFRKKMFEDAMSFEFTQGEKIEKPAKNLMFPNNSQKNH